MRLRVLLATLLLALATPASAARVVTLAPHLAELVCAAGACAQLVGTVEYSDYPASVKSLPRVGDAFAVNAEILLSLKPDLVLSWDGGTPPQTVERLRRLGLKVQPIKVEKLGDIEQAVLRIGALLSTEDAACKTADDYRRRMDALAEKYRAAPRLRVFYQIQADPIFTINRDSPISEALALCGGINIYADLPRLAGSIGKEAVLAADPDVVIWGWQDDAHGSIEAFWQRWPQARAVRSGRLYAINSDTLARATPRMVDGVEELCRALDRARAQP